MVPAQYVLLKGSRETVCFRFLHRTFQGSHTEMKRRTLSHAGVRIKNSSRAGIELPVERRWKMRSNKNMRTF